VSCDRLERDDLLGHLGEDMPHVHGCPDCRARLAGYSRLADLLAGESARPLPEMWKERTLARIRQRTSRRRAAAGLAAAGAVAAVVIVLVFRPHPEPELVVSIVPGPVQWRGPRDEPPPSASQPLKAHKGDFLKISSPPADAAHVELRVYRDPDELIVRCPGLAAPTCSVGDVIKVSWPLPSVGGYRILWLASPSPLPPPAGGLDADMRAARRAGAVALEGQEVDVN
jgi:hypothetical protein